MFISKKKYNELNNKLDSMYKLLGDVLAHTGRVINNNHEILQECKDLVQMNKNMLVEFTNTWKKLYAIVAINGGMSVADDYKVTCGVTTSASTDTGTEG